MLSTEHKPHVKTAVGGSVSTVNYGISSKTNPYRNRSCGGPRKLVEGFSTGSRRRLLRHLAGINRSAFREYGGKVYSITLTYPKQYPDFKTSKDNLRSFKQRLERRFGKFAGYWRLGLQERGAPHYHLILFAPSSFGTQSLRRLRGFVARAWYEVTGELCIEHLKAGTNVQKLDRWKKVLGYAERYIAKKESFKGRKTGRIWGKWRADKQSDILPIETKIIRVAQEDLHKIRRWYRKIARIKGHGALNSLTIFVPHDDVIRMLEWMGYSLE